MMASVTPSLEDRVAALDTYLAAAMNGTSVTVRQFAHFMQETTLLLTMMTERLTTRGLTIVDDRGRVVASLGLSGDGRGELVVLDPETNQSVRFTP